MEVGQQARLHLDVLSRDGWAQIKRAPDLEVAGALILRVETQGTRLNETIDGAAFSGQRYELLIFPRRAGVIEIPSVPVEVEIRQWGAGATSIMETLRTPELKFTATAPPGAENLRELITTTEFQARQEWSSATNAFFVGDTLKRTLRFRAKDVPGMAIPPRAKPALDGVAVYPDPPEVADTVNRGELTGRRVETVTFLFQRPGEVALPDVEALWWNPRTRELKREHLPGRTITVQPNPALAAPTKLTPAEPEPAASSRLDWRWTAALLGLLVGTLAVLGLTRRRLLASWERWQNRRRDREPARFRAFERAARSGDPRATYNALMHWLHAVHVGAGPARLDQFLAQHGDTEARATATSFISQLLDHAAAPWDARPLIHALRRARAHRLTRTANLTYCSGPHLAPLNPACTRQAATASSR